LKYNDTGSSNTALGQQAIQGISGARLTGTMNTAVGASALLLGQGAATKNTVMGYQAGAAVTTGTDNTLVGYTSGSLVTGNFNIILGEAGNITTGSSNILIGNNLANTTATSSSQLNIGDTIYGNLSTGNVGIGATNPTAKLQVESNDTTSTGLRLNNTNVGTGNPTVEFFKGGSGLWDIYADSNGLGFFKYSGSATPFMIQADGKLKIVDGNQAAGKVLTSDLNGVATWTAPAAGAVSAIGAATSTNTLANANFAQTWNWDTLTTQNAMTMASTSQTSGNILSLNGTNNSSSSTGSLLKVGVTGVSNAATGIMVTNAGTGNSLRINDDGSDADTTPFVVDSSGRVGIGTATPDAQKLLNVIGDGIGGIVKFERQNNNTNIERGVLQILATSTGTMADGHGAGIYFLIDGTGVTEQQVARMSAIRDGADNSGKLEFATASAGTESVKMTIKPNGDIGMGIATPTINGSNGRVFHIHNPNTDFSNSSSIVHFTNGTTGSAQNQGFGVGRWNTGSNFVGTWSNEGVDLVTNQINRVRIHQDGNVGINTYGGVPGTPEALFEVQGTEATDSVILLDADEGDDAADSWWIKNQAADNDFTISNATTEWFRITDTGNVGIGSTGPVSKLEVNGQARNVASISNATSTINFLTSNLQYTASNCGTFNLHNLKDGGSYTFAVKGTTSTTCTFNGYSDAGSTALTVHMPPDHGVTTAGKHTIYTFLVMGSDAYVSWIPGY
jgi:hypothetical protein